MLLNEGSAWPTTATAVGLSASATNNCSFDLSGTNIIKCTIQNIPTALGASGAYVQLTRNASSGLWSCSTDVTNTEAKKVCK
ncbi:pilin [Craterilacuibacter sp. RT1T]|nr:pilin [Craterilacuibacter sp. RT1T]